MNETALIKLSKNDVINMTRAIYYVITSNDVIDRYDVIFEPYKADVIVPNMKNATDVLQSLQRQRFGKKRILVTLTQQSDMR